jgi:hypothetical protein
MTSDERKYVESWLKEQENEQENGEDDNSAA